jgi:hypothetical protein
MGLENCTPGASNGEAADIPASSGPAPCVPPMRLPRDPLSAMVAEINGTVHGLSPSLTMAGEYLGASLATQIGFLTSAGHYQQQSMVAMAAAAANVRRLHANATKRSTAGLSASQATPPWNDDKTVGPKQTSAAACRAAETAAEDAMGKAADAVEDTGF